MGVQVHVVRVRANCCVGHFRLPTTRSTAQHDSDDTQVNEKLNGKGANPLNWSSPTRLLISAPAFAST